MKVIHPVVDVMFMGDMNLRNPEGNIQEWQLPLVFWTTFVGVLNQTDMRHEAAHVDPMKELSLVAFQRLIIPSHYSTYQ